MSMTEREVRSINTEVYIFRCPHCNTLILNDVYAWKVNGVVFHATEEMFDEYIKHYHGGTTALKEVSS